MILKKLLILLLVSSSLGDVDVDFSVDFFKARGVRFVCSFSCGKVLWNYEFANKAINSSISISTVIMDNVFGIHEKINICLGQKLTSIGVYVETNCLLFEDLLLHASTNSFFDDNHKWLITDIDDGLSNDTDVFEDVERNLALPRFGIFDMLNLSVDADITLSLQKGSENVIYEIYNFGKIRGGDVIFQKLGDWNNKSGILLQLSRYKYYKRWDFNESTLNLVTVMSIAPKKFEVDMIIGNHPKPGVSIITIIGLRILEEIKKIHNIRFNYTITDKWIGSFKRNSTWAASDNLFFREQDLTPVLRFTPEVRRKLNFLSVSVGAIETRYYYRIPTTGPGNLENEFLRPLTPGAWACVSAVTSLCALMLFLAAKVERRPAALQYALFSIMATFCQQFFEDNVVNEDTRTSTARQLAVLVTGISCVLIYNYYTSSVVSWLLNAPPPSINSLEELLESPLSLIFQDVGYTRSWLQIPGYYFNKKNAVVENKLRRYKVFNKKKGDPLLVPLEQGVEMMKAGGYAYHTEVYNANTLISRTCTQSELCELGSLQSISKTDLFPSVPLNSPYKEFFDWNLLRLNEAGIISRIKRLSSNPEIACAGSSPRALALGGAAPAFLLLAFGFLLAAVLLFMERIFNKNSSKLSQKTESP